MSQDKILIISNACFSQTDSNGRNLSRLLDCFEKGQKAQFYTYGVPDFNECVRYYRVSDKDAFESFVKLKRKDGSIESTALISNCTTRIRNEVKKTPLKMMIREFVWKYGLWKNNYLNKWIDSFNPNCVLVVAGDNCFTLDLARKISKKNKIPLFLYSTEEYPFKDYNYVTKKTSFFYYLWRKKLLKSYKKIEKYVNEAVFNSESLANLYSTKYSYKCSYIYQSSNIDFIRNDYIQAEPVISYLGNLGLNRFRALIEIADVLREVCPNAKLDIYGRFNSNIKKELECKENIQLHSFVSYDEVVRIIHNSTLLVHAEVNNRFYNRDLRYAFSTKIADSVCSGTPLLIYAPEDYEETKFLIRNKCAFVAKSKTELKKVIYDSLFNSDKRTEVVSNAFFIREKYFISRGKFKSIVEAVLNESDSN